MGLFGSSNRCPYYEGACHCSIVCSHGKNPEECSAYKEFREDEEKGRKNDCPYKYECGLLNQWGGCSFQDNIKSCVTYCALSKSYEISDDSSDDCEERGASGSASNARSGQPETLEDCLKENIENLGDQAKKAIDSLSSTLANPDTIASSIKGIKGFFGRKK